MLLHAEKESLLWLRLFRALYGCIQIAGGLGRRFKVAFLLVLFEDHIYYSRGPTPARSHSATSRLARAAGAADSAPGTNLHDLSTTDPAGSRIPHPGSR